MKREMNCEQAKQNVRIDDYLQRKGYRPVKSTANGLWFHSLVNEDRTASLEISPDGRMFHDWSTGTSGSVVDMAMLVTHGSISSALSDIAGTSGIVESKETGIARNYKHYGMSIISAMPVRSAKLFGYAYGRGIRRDVVFDYCHEVCYINGRTSRLYYALGFPNDNGGFELRSHPFKGSSAPKGISTIGDIRLGVCLVFEGFFDFLSAVQLKWFRPSEMCAVVLNSTSMVAECLEFLCNYSGRVICLLDNDESGRKTTDCIVQAVPRAEGKSFLFSPAKDLNDYLVAYRNNSKNK